MKKIIATLVLILATYVFSADTSYAWIDLPDLSGMSEAVQDVADKAVCQAAKPKVYAKFTKLNGVCRDQYDHLNNILSRLNTIVTSAGANGYDVDRLENDRRILLTKFNIWNNECHMMYNLLHPISTYSCNSGTNQDLAHLKNRVSSARGFVDNAKDNAKEMRSFYREVIRDDISDLKNQRYRENN